MKEIHQLLKYIQYRLGPEYFISLNYDNGNIIFLLHSNSISYSKALPKNEIIDNAWNPFYDETVVTQICKECEELKEQFKKGD